MPSNTKIGHTLSYHVWQSATAAKSAKRAHHNPLKHHDKAAKKTHRAEAEDNFTREHLILRAANALQNQPRLLKPKVDEVKPVDDQVASSAAESVQKDAGSTGAIVSFGKLANAADPKTSRKFEENRGAEASAKATASSASPSIDQSKAAPATKALPDSMAKEPFGRLPKYRLLAPSSPLSSKLPSLPWSQP